MKSENYNFAEEFTKNPGLRFRKLSEFSGEEFREDVLEKFFSENKKIVINIDGIESSLGSSFLSEAFGNIAVKYGKEKFIEIVEIDTNSEIGMVTNDEMLKRVDEAIKRANGR
ncbi:MAG: STAS-like domain-containing protein [Arcobacteraceae bacterium]|nr:STAS-like domain-containing protein [Arcobacteraceae bacterium]